MLVRLKVHLLLYVLVAASCSHVKFEVGKRNEEKMLRNLGIVESLNTASTGTRVSRESMARVFGVHVDSSSAIEVTHTMVEESTQGHVHCALGKFTAYDRVQIPFYELLPPGFEETKIYPVVILFSGHGSMDQVAHGEWSYQRGAALDLAKAGFVVYTMENRGMGMLSNLGDHLKIDAVARLTGGSWYGELITDGLYLIELVKTFDHVDQERIGVGGVSTGGALSLFTAAMDQDISAVYVQGYLGSFKTTFGTRSNHHICNNIAGVLNHFDLPDIGATLAPRPAMYVNGELDTFYHQDAQLAFEQLSVNYAELGVPHSARFEVPDNTIHEMSVDLLVAFFKEQFHP